MIRDEQLASGLHLVTERMEDARSVCIGFWVGTGSRDEGADEAGASHFLEHLLFKGTGSRSAAAIAEAVDEVGGDFNAFTTKEYTSFYIRLLAENLFLGLDILSDIMWRPALRPADVDAERQVILDEILMHADEPSDEAAEQSASATFPGHPLGRDVLGTAGTGGSHHAGGHPRLLRASLPAGQHGGGGGRRPRPRGGGRRARGTVLRARTAARRRPGAPRGRRSNPCGWPGARPSRPTW